MKNPYEVLGMNADSPDEVLTAKYDELKARYSEQRFRVGEEGNEGARLLSELESAWQLIKQDMDRRRNQSTFGGSYEGIDALVRKQRLNEAQDILDSMPNRTAEWHYYQAMVFYRKDWLSESRTQLSIAVNMEPNNQKYQDALNKINIVMGSATVNAQTVGGENRGPYSEGEYNHEYHDGSNNTSGTGNFLANCCATYCMLEMCCSLTRCC